MSARSRKRKRRPAIPASNRNKSQTPALPPKEVLDKLPENVRISAVEAASFTGPLPPPSMFSHYNEVLPGAAERILRITEKEQDHRIAWESKALTLGARNNLIGQVFGLIALVLCIGSATYMALNGLKTVPAILVGTTTVGTIGWFIRSRSQQPEGDR